MTTTDPEISPPAFVLGRLPRRQLAWDSALAAVCLIATLVVNLSGVESVAQNRDHDVASVSLTVLAVGSLALRRRFPLQVLLVILVALLGLVLMRGTVGLATIGPLLAFYTAVAIGTRPVRQAAVGAVVAALVLTAVLQPVDLSQEGALVNAMAFVGAYVFALGTRSRNEKSAADVDAAEQRAELERERAHAERERAARAATEERLQITRELHDIIGHAMSVMVVQAGVAERLLDTRPDEARTAVVEIARTGRRSLGEMRQLLGVLRDGDGVLETPAVQGEPSEHGPAPTLLDVEGLAARIRVAGLPVSVVVRGDRPHLAAGVDLAAYRVVQEALTNCLRHSGASHASVEIGYLATTVEIQVVDDGDVPAGPTTPAGHGIAGMRERVAIYGGALTAGRGADGGFCVQARLPLGERTEVP